jgi:hypothetical protein
MRAFRPSRYSPYERDEQEELAENQVKQAKVRFYAKRVQDGLPLFDPSSRLKTHQQD